MRIIRADFKDVVNLHRLYIAYCQDAGIEHKPDEVFQRWVGELCNENKYYMILMHGRKALGLVWGTDLGSSFEVEGIFLKRAWRGKYRFSKWIYRALLEKKKKFGILDICIPVGCSGINVAKFKPKLTVYSY